MKRIAAPIIALATITLAGYAFAQDTEEADTAETTVEAPANDMHFRRGPVDLDQFAKMDDLKAADTDGDGTLSRDELEAFALQQVVRRMADRMERRLDVNGDGSVTLDEIEKQKQKEFAALDRNEDGKLDRHEMRAGHTFGKHGRHGGRGFHHRGPMWR